MQEKGKGDDGEQINRLFANITHYKREKLWDFRDFIVLLY